MSVRAVDKLCLPRLVGHVGLEQDAGRVGVPLLSGRDGVMAGEETSDFGAGYGRIRVMPLA